MCSVNNYINHGFHRKNYTFKSWKLKGKTLECYFYEGGFTEFTTVRNQSKTGPKEAIQPLEGRQKTS